MKMGLVGRLHFNTAISAQNTGHRALLSSSMGEGHVSGRDVFFSVDPLEHKLPNLNSEFDPRLRGGFVGYDELLLDAVDEVHPLKAHSFLAKPADQSGAQADQGSDVNSEDKSGHRSE